MQTLDLSRNLFTGLIPSSLMGCQRLKSLHLGSNNFSGPLPIGFGSSLVLLEKLDLSFNLLNGSIPGDIGKLSSLQGTVDLSHNLFSGLIPPSLANLPEKVYIDLSFNNLSGLIPQNDALVNRGPTAFIGNPGLCGPPLKRACNSSFSVDVSSPSSSVPFEPGNYQPPVSQVGSSEGNSGKSNSHRGLSNALVIAVVVSDVFGISVIALLFFYCYKRATSSVRKEKVEGSDSNNNKGPNVRKECRCFFAQGESETISEDTEQHDLVPLDGGVRFNMDELLKASAFVLGKSWMGIVYKVVLEDGMNLAVRRLGEGSSQRFKEFKAEVEAIGKIKHPHIVTLRAYYWSNQEKLLIYDYIPNGNLSAAIHGKPGMLVFKPMSWGMRVNIMRGIAQGLTFLHEFSPKKCVHGDLRPNNILLGENMEPYISDLGLGRLVNIVQGSSLLQSDRVATEKPQIQQTDVPFSPTPKIGSCYHAPEALRTLKPSQKCDVYSYGVLLMELISGRPPMFLLDTSELDLVKWFEFCMAQKRPLRDLLDPNLAPELQKEDEMISVLKIALACVQINAEKRPSMRNVVDTLDRLINAK
ncbi:hypothetical protein J5N97_004118 [Dioscorea zingiberensis]|uniref:Protein kinase domain-containing protein n=1 Tax=Dioscorea zingiberensis TaxID=325984 RepID=A0A9D5D7A1_9LILI|nr:hypothetical protein J5N97_004118 [Dioscorea zingiberensis]